MDSEVNQLERALQQVNISDAQQLIHKTLVSNPGTDQKKIPAQALVSRSVQSCRPVGTGYCLLEELPPELQLCLIDLLPWESFLRLREASKHFSALTTIVELRIHFYRRVKTLLQEEMRIRESFKVPLAERPRKGPMYLLGELWNPDLPQPYKHLKLACYRCLEWKEPDSFSNGMRYQHRMVGQGGAYKRRCFDCGRKSGLYAKGSSVFGMGRGVCLQCGEATNMWRNGRPGERVLVWSQTRWCENCVSTKEEVARLKEYQTERRQRKYNTWMEWKKRTHDIRRLVWQGTNSPEDEFDHPSYGVCHSCWEFGPSFRYHSPHASCVLRSSEVSH